MPSKTHICTHTRYGRMNPVCACNTYTHMPQNYYMLPKIGELRKTFWSFVFSSERVMFHISPFLDPAGQIEQQYLTSTFKGLITFMIQVYAVLGKGMEYRNGKKRKD